MSDTANIPQNPLTPEEKNNLLNEIGNGLISAAAHDWTEITYTVNSTAIFATASNFISYPEEEAKHKSFPADIMRKSKILRSNMYQPDKGTWFTMKMHIIRPARYKVEYNYNDPPNFDLPPNPETYAEEQKRFPRSPENMPDWYKKELYRAGWYD